MSSAFAFISNDPSLTACALANFPQALTVEQGAPDGWGMGYYQSGQPLLRKQPKPHDGPLDFTSLASNLRATIIIGHVRKATHGGTRTENTHPFRFRNWLCWHLGTIERFDSIREDMLRSVPDFICRNIRGKTDSEHLFHLFLSFLNDTGKLDDFRIPVSTVAQALGSTYAYLERLVVDRGGVPADEACLVTNGSVVAAIRRGTPLHVTRKAAFSCPDAEGRLVRAPKLKTVVILAGKQPTDPGWEEVADRSLVTVDADMNLGRVTP